MRKWGHQLIIIVVFALLGFALTFQLMHIKEDYSFISLKTVSDLQNEINTIKSEMNNIQDLIETTSHRLEEYQNAVAQDGSIVEVLEAEIEQMKILSGYVDLEGPGITVKMSDAVREMYPWEYPEDLIIHEFDVLLIVQELKFAGAEALSINGQRIMPHTEIKCSGPTITINNHTYGQPFIIKAIGNPATLEAAINSAQSSSQLLREYGISVESLVSPWVRIPKYEGEVPMQYITPKEDE